jgi:hypothetical protein
MSSSSSSKSKYTVIGHSTLFLCNPIAPAHIDAVLQRMDLSSTSEGIDFGAGKAELSIRLAEMYGMQSTAVEWDGEFVKEGMDAAAKRNVSSMIKFVEDDGGKFHQLVASRKDMIDVAINIGSVHIFDGYENTLNALVDIVYPGRYILVGDLHWKKPSNINQEFLDFLQIPSTHFLSHEKHIELGQERQLELIYTYSASDEEWTTYEETLHHNREFYCQSHPEDPDVPMILGRSRGWYDAHQRWGKDELGFALYLFRRR